MADKKGIAIVGTVLVDKIYGISAYPSAGELTPIRTIDLAVGGIVPNDGIDLKKLAPELDVLAVCKVGDDGDGKFIIDNLKKNGADVELKLYPGARHELFNETNREEVFSDLVSWLLKIK